MFQYKNKKQERLEWLLYSPGEPCLKAAQEIRINVWSVRDGGRLHSSPNRSQECSVSIFHNDSEIKNNDELMMRSNQELKSWALNALASFAD